VAEGQAQTQKVVDTTGQGSVVQVLEELTFSTPRWVEGGQPGKGDQPPPPPSPIVDPKNPRAYLQNILSWGSTSPKQGSVGEGLGQAGAGSGSGGAAGEAEGDDGLGAQDKVERSQSSGDVAGQRALERFHSFIQETPPEEVLRSHGSFVSASGLTSNSDSYGSLAGAADIVADAVRDLGADGEVSDERSAPAAAKGEAGSGEGRERRGSVGEQQPSEGEWRSAAQDGDDDDDSPEAPEAERATAVAPKEPTK